MSSVLFSEIVEPIQKLTDAIERLTAEIREQPKQVFKCSSCVGKYLTAFEDQKNGVLHDGQPVELPPIEDGVVMLPSWQSQMIGPQMVVTAVALPSCLACCNVQEESEVERATKSGLVLGGPHGMPN